MTAQNMVKAGMAVGVAALLAVAGCSAKPTATVRPAAPGASPSTPAGSLPSTDKTSPSASASPARTQPLQRCHTADLTGHVEGHGEGAGQRYAMLGLTNKTAIPCTIYGYPGLQLVDADGRPRQTTAHWDRATEPTRLVVRHRQTVWALLHWTVITADDEVASECGPATAGLLVIPPDETTQLRMAFAPGQLCQHGQIIVSAFGRERPADG